MNFADKLSRRFRNFGIPHLMNYVVIGMALVFAMDYLLPALGISSLLSLNMALVARGQIWRLITFIFLPPPTSLLFILFSLYFYWMIGSALESEWGKTRFTLFYLVGIIGSILSALVTGYVQNTYLNLSLFLAFAALYPDFQVNLFFFLPVKMKYLAILDLVLYGWQLVVGTWSTRLAIVLALANVILFVGGSFLKNLKNDSQYWKTRRNFRKAMRN